MKTDVHTRTFIKGLGLIQTPQQNPLLLHFLSPLEAAAFKNNFRQFSYKLGRETLEIDAAMCSDLFSNAKNNLRFYHHLLQFSRQKVLMRDAKTKRFLTMPLQKHQLPTRLYHVFVQHDCTSMSHVAYKGIDELRQMRGMGKIQLNYLIKLFTDNGCANLL